MVGQIPDCGDVGGAGADPGFSFDAGAQFEIAQRIESVVGERTIGVDGAAQDQADLLGDQTTKSARPLVAGEGR